VELGPPYAGYRLDAAYEEMFARDDSVHPHCAALDARLSTLTSDDLMRR